MCCDIMAFSSLAFCGIYLLFAILPAYLDERKKLLRNEDKLIQSLQPGGDNGNLTIEFENNRSQLGQGALNDSNQNSTREKR